MAKKGSKAKTLPKAVEVRYDLTELPTAQHKAGLAGLVMAIRSLEERSRKAPDQIPPEEVPQIVGDIGVTKVTIRFTEQSVQRLFDDIYDASVVEVTVKSKWQGQEPKRVVEVEEPQPDGKKPKRSKRFIYDQVEPRGAFLPSFFEGEERGLWMKLWRDMLWTIPRGINTTRGPFEARAGWGGKKEGRIPVKPCPEGPKAWRSLQSREVSGGVETVESLASCLLLGAQDANAEGIGFLGRSDQTLLLHFWPFAVTVSVPAQVKADGESEFVGFVLAIPEVSDLAWFCRRFPDLLNSLSAQRRGFRPAEAVVDLAAQGALEFIRHVAQIAEASAETASVAAVSSVEFLHLDRQGNTIKLLASGRITSSPHLLNEYRGIVGRPGQKPDFRNPLFRAARILALLRGKPWWGEMLSVLVTRDWHFFLPADDTQEKFPAIAKLPWFWADVRRQFQIDAETLQLSQETDMSELPEEFEAEKLSTLLNKVVYAYVTTRAKQKSGIDPEDKKFKTGEDKIDWDRVPKEFKDERAEAAQSLFLEFRSRREQAFVHHFAQTFFACKQFLTNEESNRLATLLLDRDRLDDVKTLTLLALSKNS